MTHYFIHLYTGVYLACFQRFTIEKCATVNKLQYFAFNSLGDILVNGKVGESDTTISFNFLVLGIKLTSFAYQAGAKFRLLS